MDKSKKPLVFVIEDNEIMSELISDSLKGLVDVKIFNNAVTAISEISNVIPKIIFLDILLTGPNGFTFLNELVSYRDTSSIPVVVITSLDLHEADLTHYGIVKVFNKETMYPEQLREITKKILAETNVQ